jgi:hypothetical protein
MIVPKLKIRNAKNLKQTPGLLQPMPKSFHGLPEKDRSSTDDIDMIGHFNSISPELSSFNYGDPVRGKSRSRGTGRPRGRPKRDPL